MNRKIMFRGKSVITGEWIYSMTIANGTIKRKRDHVYMEVLEDKWVQVDPKTVGQWIGPTDRNGKEIYEGDIHREEIEMDEGDERTYYVCVWLNEWSRFAWITADEYKGYRDNGIKFLDESLQETFGVFEYDSIAYTICGNIHDSPELLKCKLNVTKD